MVTACSCSPKASAEPRLRHRPPEFRHERKLHEQTIAQLDLWLNSQKKPTLSHCTYKNGEVYRLPKILDEEVARLHLGKLGVHLTKLTQAQADYIGVPVEGPFKAEFYRY